MPATPATPTPAITIRKGTEADLPQAVALIRELAAHEQCLHELAVSPEELLRDGAGPQPLFDFLVAEAAGEVVGLAVIFDAYSTWKGKTLYLEDLVVRQSWRSHGIGAQLFEAVKQEAKSRQARRLLWQVHDYNTAAIRFYERQRAHLDGSWLNGSLMQEDF